MSAKSAAMSSNRGAPQSPHSHQHNTRISTSTIVEKFRRDDALDLEFHFSRLNDYHTDQHRLGWLINARPDGTMFKAAIPYHPYFYLSYHPNYSEEVQGYLLRKYSAYIEQIEFLDKIDLDKPNHLSGLTCRYLCVKFLTVQDLVACRDLLMPSILSKGTRYDILNDDSDYNTTNDMMDDQWQNKANVIDHDYADYILGIREYDIPYYQRVMIDTNIRVSNWYNISYTEGKIQIVLDENMQLRAEPKVLAFDIECTKQPLKFPDAKTDEVMMISYMIDGQGYLIINRMHVSSDIEPFEYTPKPDLKGHFMIWNEKNELAVLNRFVDHIKKEHPTIFVTFNGDGFDWKFLEERSRILGIPLSRSIGLTYNKHEEFYTMTHACHLDVFAWVRRDSYLPQGSQGLKAVTKSKLGYDPLEIDPELMVSYALTKPVEMAQYSVSDAVATYYLYVKYVHPFIFSLCNILPMHPDDVLRKGTGTLCEALLMVEAYKLNIIFPNKKGGELGKMYDGHLIESETYVGGHVEALATGIYRADLPIEFHINKNCIQELIDDVPHIIKFAVEIEHKANMADLVNYEEVKNTIISQLEPFLSQGSDGNGEHSTVSSKSDTNHDLQDQKHQKQLLHDNWHIEEPQIYHVDVAAMYPNIILTNRLQPSSIVTDTQCSNCLFNHPQNNCKRKMMWQWRVDYLPSKRSEYEQVKSQLELEMFPIKDLDSNESMIPYFRLPASQRQEILTTRLKQYCRTVYKRTHETQIIQRKDTVCMRENPFYVDTVLKFRDRRYIYRSQAKEFGRALEEAKKQRSPEKTVECSNMMILYDSLQLAHKCILNSFYGYVMRKGARWYSMEMAAIVTYTGALIIKRSRELIEKIGKALELDTDGIWCCLPKSFPGSYTLIFRNNPSSSTLIATDENQDRKLSMNFICSALNARIHREFSNDQYQTLTNAKSLNYTTCKECFIFFELDGPYKAMILPTSIHADTQLKKRYAVFGFDNELHEFKGFELKRRGELKAIKDFQSQIFKTFLQGNTLKDAYAAAAHVAEYFLNILDTHAVNLRDSELLELLSESRNMNRDLEDYKKQKSTSITTARRLADFLGEANFKEKGLNCRFIISKKPDNKSVAERSIPVQIFSANRAIQMRFIRKWCGDNSITQTGLREILDWDYYRTRLSNQFQKLITLPAYFQGIDNPLKSVPHPDWLLKRLRQLETGKTQVKLTDVFQKNTSRMPMNLKSALTGQPKEDVTDTLPVSEIEDMFLPKDTIDQDQLLKNSHLYKANEKSLETHAHNQKIASLDTSDHLGHIFTPSQVIKPDSKLKQQQLIDFSFSSNAQGRNVNTSSNGSSSRKRYREFLKNQPEDGLIDALGIPPEESQDPEGWLKWHQTKWRLQISRRKRMKKELDPNTTLPLSSGILSTQVHSFLNRANMSVLQSPWNILQFRESERPGIIKVWFLTSDGLTHETHINIPRRFYINSYVPCEQYSSSQVNSCLPRQKAPHYLYEIEIPEEDYLTNNREIEIQLSDANVEGVYESQIPLTFRAIVELGCLCRVKLKHRNHRIDEPWHLDQLEYLIPSKLHNYLPDPQPKFLYLFQIGVSNRLVYGLYDSVRLIFTILYTSVRDQQGVASSLAKIAGIRELGIKIELIFETSQSLSCAVLHRISEFKRCKQGPIVVISQCAIPFDSLTQHIPILNDLPVIQMSINKRDQNIPALGWLLRVSSIFVQRALKVSKWYNMAINLARYARVPIGNFTADFAIFMSDVMFSRRLKSSDNILWYSEGLSPDLGCSNENEITFASELINPTQCNPGCIETMSIEIDIKGLAVNTILQSNFIPNIDSNFLMNDGPNSISQHGSDHNADNMSQDPSKACETSKKNPFLLPRKIAPNTLYFAPTSDNSYSCARAFKLLKNMVTTWSIDTLTDDGGTSADLLVSNFFRWLSSPHSYLYDPVLHQVVHKLLKTVFTLLLTELKVLGTRVIYASFNKLILATNKESYPDAQSYFTFLQKTFKRNRELFRYIELEPRHFYEILIFRDLENFVGIPVKLQQAKETKKDSSVNVEQSQLLTSYQGIVAEKVDPLKNEVKPINLPTSSQDPLLDPPNDYHSGNSISTYENLDSMDSTTGLVHLFERNDASTPISVLQLADYYLPKPIRPYLTVILWGFALELLKLKRLTLKKIQPSPALGLERDDVNHTIIAPQSSNQMVTLAQSDLHNSRGPAVTISSSKRYEDTLGIGEKPNALHDNDLITQYYRSENRSGKNSGKPGLSKASISNQHDPQGQAKPLSQHVIGTDDLSLDMTNSINQDDVLEECSKLVRILTDQMYNMTIDIRDWPSKYQSGSQDALNSNINSSVLSDLPVENAALEFIKLACYFLSLKSALDVPMTTLKHNLLKLLKIQEFSEGSPAILAPLTSSYTLWNITCSYCNACQDLSLLSDSKSPNPDWNCPTCLNPFDKASIEERLINLARSKIGRFQLQDLVCQKCRLVQAGNINYLCPNCSGPLTTKETRSDIIRRLCIFRDVAKFHDFERLAESLAYTRFKI